VNAPTFTTFSVSIPMRRSDFLCATGDSDSRPAAPHLFESRHVVRDVRPLSVSGRCSHTSTSSGTCGGALARTDPIKSRALAPISPASTSASGSGTSVK
jgi:hypothetical protein